jgi:diguanylate cyclase (GGDEF)-like protein
VSLLKRLLRKSAGLGGRIGVQTLVSILGSLALTAALTFLFVGVDSRRTFTVAELWRIGLSISTIAPALICPLIAFRTSKLMRELRTAHDELADLAGKDTLTGLMNRRGFDAAAAHVFAEARRLGQPIGAIMCDIDMFKDINDRYGHDVGDIVLIDVAQLIRRSVGARPAILGRQGGDEFAILLPGVDLEDAAGIAEGLRQACEGRSAVRLDGAARVTLSLGVATTESSRQTNLRAILKHADAALYEAKRGGRNLVVRFSGMVARQGSHHRREPGRRDAEHDSLDRAGREDARVIEAAPLESTPKPLADLC